jgi:hypothetical protein
MNAHALPRRRGGALRRLAWLSATAMLAVSALGPAATGVAAAEPGSPDFVPFSGNTSSSGLTLVMSKTATMSCTGGSVNSVSGSFTFSGSGHVVVYLTPNTGSDADPVGNVSKNELTIDLTGKTSPYSFTLTITSPFTTTKGGVLAVFASDVVGVNNYNSKSNSLNCTESPSTPPSTPPSAPPSSPPSAPPSTPPSAPPSTPPSTPPSQAPSEAPSTPPSEAPSQAASEAPSQAASQAPSTAPSAAPSGEVLPIEGTPQPTGEVEAIQGTPRVTPPPTDTIADASASSTGSWRIVLAGLAILIAIILVATQPTTRVRRTR